MKLNIIEKRKKDPRYFLLKFTINYLTDNGKKGYVNNRKYNEFVNRMPNKPFGCDTIQRVYRTLLFKRINYDLWVWIYKEMKQLGYQGTPIERPIINKKIVERGIILYCSEYFVNQNKSIFSEK